MIIYDISECFEFQDAKDIKFGARVKFDTLI